MCVSGIVGLGRRGLAGGKGNEGEMGQMVSDYWKDLRARSCAVVPVPWSMRVLGTVGYCI